MSMPRRDPDRNGPSVGVPSRGSGPAADRGRPADRYLFPAGANRSPSGANRSTAGTGRVSHRPHPTRIRPSRRSGPEPVGTDRTGRIRFRPADQSGPIRNRPNGLRRRHVSSLGLCLLGFRFRFWCAAIPLPLRFTSVVFRVVPSPALLPAEPPVRIRKRGSF